MSQEQGNMQYAMKDVGMCVELLVVCIMEGSRLLAFSAGRKTTLKPHADSRKNPCDARKPSPLQKYFF